MTLARLLLISVALIMTLSSEAFATTPACMDVYGTKAVRSEAIQTQDPNELQSFKNYFASFDNVDLLRYRLDEVNIVSSRTQNKGDHYIIANNAIEALTAKLGNRRWSQKEIIDELNEQQFRMIEKFQPINPLDRRIDGLPRDVVQRILESIEEHPIVSSWGDQQFQQKHTQIGYCFGRACYVDSLATRLGLDRDSIKKIWAVGPMGEWQFHVATMLRLDDGSWVVVDNVPQPQKLYTPREWAEHFQLSGSTGTNIRFYITEADKFTPSLGDYDDTQLGLNIPKTRDWYRGYFQAMKNWFQTTDDSALLRFLKLEALPERPNPTGLTPDQVSANNREDDLASRFPPESDDSQIDAMSHQPERRRTILDTFRKWGRKLGF